MITYEKDLLTEKIIDYCFRIHNELDHGFPERIYHNALILLLKEEGVDFETEKELDIFFNKKKGVYEKLHKLINFISPIMGLGNIMGFFFYKNYAPLGQCIAPLGA